MTGNYSDFHAEERRRIVAEQLAAARRTATMRANRAAASRTRRAQRERMRETEDEFARQLHEYKSDAPISRPVAVDGDLVTFTPAERTPLTAAQKRTKHTRERKARKKARDEIARTFGPESA